MAVARYIDVIKSAKDLLTKPYLENNKVELKATAANGNVVTVESALGPVATKAGKKPVPTLAVKGEGVVHGGFKVDKLSLDSNHDLTGEFSLNNAFKGTKLTFKATDGTRAAAIEGVDPISAVIGVEHKADVGTFTLDVDAIKYSAEATGVCAFKGFLVGASGKVARTGDKFGLVDYGALLGYKTGDVTAAVVSNDKFDSFTVSYHQVVNKNLSLAAQAKVPKAVAKADKFEVAAGVTYATSPDVTLAGKVTHSGKVGVSYAQVLSPLAKLTVSAEVDAPKIATDSAHKLNLGVTFTA